MEERSVKTTVQQVQLTEVAFRKDVNMAVHLRKIEQAQWKMENELQYVSNWLLLCFTGNVIKLDLV